MERTAAVLMMLAVATACGGGEESIEIPDPTAADGREIIIVEDAEAYPIDEATGTYGIYMRITNDGPTLDRLVEAAVDACGTTELRETTDEDGAIAVSPLAGGIVIPPNTTLVLGPGAATVVCVGLVADVSEGDSLEVTVVFEEAGPLSVIAVVTSEL